MQRFIPRSFPEAHSSKRLSSQSNRKRITRRKKEAGCTHLAGGKCELDLASVSRLDGGANGKREFITVANVVPNVIACRYDWHGEVLLAVSTCEGWQERGTANKVVLKGWKAAMDVSQCTACGSQRQKAVIVGHNVPYGRYQQPRL
jgi:hypothetical protein